MPPVGAYDTGVNGHLINDCAQIYPLLEIALTVIGSLGGAAAEADSPKWLYHRSTKDPTE